eukprot:CAMPEP_0168791714 /NCGR_PEP_ID=MMETSP0725-20121227/14132_2 /TAXON_ID=265536 /ORGANISM="Amphiprora sp., Strain CCMP467" /LENGTH=151 /DNA_ID=CAMNT_0008842307 /DNA_START=107 /DNA_END=561 /DNA_ORIENTATION=-
MSANAYNIARRLSAKNENDMMQEDMMEPASSPHTKKSCFEFLSKAYSQDSPIPTECERFDELKVAVQRRNTDPPTVKIPPLPTECERFDELKVAVQRRNTDPKSQEAFAGLSHGDRVSAEIAREKGRLNHHQIQRRMTTSTKKNKVWSGSW